MELTWEMTHFDHVHYVPILRWKGAERDALCELFRFNGGTPPIDDSQFTPLLEIPPDKFILNSTEERVEVNELLSNAAEDILQNWGHKPLFVDLTLLPKHLRSSTSGNPLIVLANAMSKRLLTIIPVTGLNRTTGYQRAVRQVAQAQRNGVCLRLEAGDFQHTSLSNDIDQLLGYLRLQPEKVDLLIDWKTIYDFGPVFTALCRRLPYLPRWRTFTFASGAFPKDLTGFTVGRNKWKRWDWITWRDQVTQSSLPRIPTYSDYTIQHPLYTQHDPDKFLNPSASIRYTYEEYWLIMRGEGLFHSGSPGHHQYPANAYLLCEQEEFFGPDFSFGDAYIKERSLELAKEEIEKTGNPKTWLQAGINHHIALVLRQIAKLFGS